MKHYLILLFLLTTFCATAQKYEQDYQEIINQTFKGKTEYSVQNGRVDILTDSYAIEVEFANKWKQSIGQALWYAQQTDKQPGIVLILRSKVDYKYFIQLETTLQYANLKDKVKVWIYPNDFPNYGAEQPTEVTPEATGSYWITTSSSVRHNSSCKYFKATRGESCTSSEGKACKLCGG